MKRIFCAFITVLLLVSVFAGCGSKDNGGASSTVVSTESDGFKKPENYASVVLVTINPQFRLYLDANGVVLAVEAVNADAKSINKKIDFKNKKVEAVVQTIVVAANDGGFINENATVDIKVASVKNEDLTAVLNTVKTSVTTKLTEMKVEAEVTAVISKDILVTDDKSSETTSSEDASSKNPISTMSPEDDDNNKDNNPPVNEPEKPACNHPHKKIFPVSTGKNIIDSSKFDMVNHKVVCGHCNADLGLEAHDVKNGICRLCKQANFETKPTSIITATHTLNGDAKLNENGSVAYEIMLDSTWYSAAKLEYAIDEWNYKIPEAAILAAIRTKFVITDAQFEALKAQGEYEFFIDTHTYKDGYFYITDPAAGGPGSYTHIAAGYKDDKNGKFTVYIDYINGGADVEESEREHICYYAVEYQYKGYSNLSVTTGEYYSSIAGYTPVVDSLRVVSMKKIANLPSDMVKI